MSLERLPLNARRKPFGPYTEQSQLEARYGPESNAARDGRQQYFINSANASSEPAMSSAIRPCTAGTR